MLKNGNFTLQLTSSGQEWQFHIATDIKWSRMAMSHCYCHLVVKNGNLYIATGIKWSRMAMSHCYWHLVVKNGNFTLLLTLSGQEWQCLTATDI